MAVGDPPTSSVVLVLVLHIVRLLVSFCNLGPVGQRVRGGNILKRKVLVLWVTWLRALFVQPLGHVHSARPTCRDVT
jgi:hypothetical protein